MGSLYVKLAHESCLNYNRQNLNPQHTSVTALLANNCQTIVHLLDCWSWRASWNELHDLLTSTNINLCYGRDELPVNKLTFLSRQTNVVANQERQDRERARHLHGMKQERTKSFMSKARMLSSGYRDNDPPLAYYKRNGLVPPDRMVSDRITEPAPVPLLGDGRERFARGARLNKFKKPLFYKGEMVDDKTLKTRFLN